MNAYYDGYRDGLRGTMDRTRTEPSYAVGYEDGVADRFLDRTPKAQAVLFSGLDLPPGQQDLPIMQEK